MMKKSIKIFSIIMAAVFMNVMLLNGCSGDPQNVKQTNKTLSVYYYKNDKNPVWFSEYVDAAIHQYQSDHPIVKIKTYDPSGGDSSLSVEQISSKLQSDIMAGKGPDVIIDTTYINLDYFKLMQSGKLWNMNEFLSKDKDFTDKNYHMNLFKSVQYKGSQYAVPVMYMGAGALLSTEETLNKFGYDPKSVRSLESFIEASKHSINTYQCRLSEFEEDSLDLLAYNSIINFDNEKLMDNTTQLKMVYEFNQFLKKHSKAISLPQKTTTKETEINGKKYYTTESENKEYNVASIMKQYPLLFVHNVLDGTAQLAASKEKLTLVSYLYKDSAVCHEVQSPVFAFVLSASPNQQAAYDFIHTLLSEDIQKNIAEFYMPVRRGLGKHISEQRKKLIQTVYIDNTSTPGGPYAMPDNTFWKQYAELCEHPYDLNLGYFLPVNLLEKLGKIDESSGTFEEYVKRTNEDLKLYFSE